MVVSNDAGIFRKFLLFVSDSGAFIHELVASGIDERRK